MQYHYLAADNNGKVYESELDANSLEEVLALIAKQNLKPISVKPIKEIVISRRGIFGEKITMVDKVFMMKYLSLMLKVGTDLFRAIDILVQDFKKPLLKSFLLEVKGNLGRGNPFYVSFQNHPELFSEIVVNLVKAAEGSGNLEKTLDEISKMYEAEADLKNKIRSALIYPGLLMIVSVGVVTLLVTFVLPRISVVFEGSGAEIPVYSRIILGLGSFLNQYSIFIFPLLIAGAAGAFFYFSQTNNGKTAFGRLLKKTPGVKDLLQKLALQRFASTLSSLLKAGIPFVHALEITSTAVGDVQFAAALRRIAKESVSRGVSIGDSFRKEGIFPNVVINLMAIGEKSGHVEEILNTLADFYAKEIDTSLKILVSVLEPAMLVIVGIIVASIAFAVIVPIYQLVSQYS